MNNIQEFTISEDEVGIRTDLFITRQYPQFARSALVKLFDSYITTNGEPAKPGYKLRKSDIVRVDTSLLSQEPPKIELPILFQDENVLVIDKPSGVLTHSKGGLNNEATVASFILPFLSGSFSGPNNRAGIVHRLDRATSGVMICAKNTETSSYLQKQFAQRKVKKTYTALIEGTIEPTEAIIDVPLERNPARPQTFHTSDHGKAARTYYKAVAQKNHMTQLELKPETGRTHQLRVHLSYISHPIIGDRVYGGKNAPRLMLHASELEITIPGGQRKTFESPLDTDITNYFEKDGKR